LAYTAAYEATVPPVRAALMATMSPPRPVVFISASHKDADWRDRVKAALEADGRTDWWDDSRIRPGRQ
jgi:hypothetical protein